MASRFARMLAGGQCLVGICLLVLPGRVAAAISSDPGERPPRWLIRLLGGRLIGQGSAQLLSPTAGLLRAGAAVDASHAASMLAVAAVSPRYRRPALSSAALASASAAAGLVAARNNT